MAKTRQQKEQMLDRINQKIKASKTLVISAFDRVSVSEDQELRGELKKNDVEHEVVKKTLLKKAFKDNKITDLPEEGLQGNISLTSSEDEVAGAKILAKFSKDNEGFRILGGFFEKSCVDADKILELAKLPSHLELIAKTVGTIKAPLNGLVNVLSGNVHNLINVLNNIKDK